MPVKHNMARLHFAGARSLSEGAINIESELLTMDPKDNAEKRRQRTYVVGAVALAVMGLEACINEIYLDAVDESTQKLPDAVDESTQKLPGVDEREKALLALWWPQVEMQPILLKYQHALLLLGKPALPKGESPYQDADSLVRLRNALTHYKPEWDDSLNVHADIESRLTGKFDLNPLSTTSSLWFPHQCLGAGCAKWAVSTAEAFVLAFCTRLGIPPRT
jgi:hypothetical protein